VSTSHRDFIARLLHQPIHAAVLDDDCECVTIPDGSDVALALMLLDALDAAGYEIVKKAPDESPPNAALDGGSDG
jgi:hypothetical protein